jgi:hypothetical protein
MPVRDTGTVSSGNAASSPPGGNEAASTAVPFRARCTTDPSVQSPRLAMPGVQHSARLPEEGARR